MLADFHHSSSSLAHRLKSSICCFGAAEQRLETPTRSPCSWLKSTACQFLCRCRYLVARIGRRRRRYHSSAADFSYDSSSYALNFEDDSRYDDEFPLRNFTARLPRVPAGSQGGITVAACS